MTETEWFSWSNPSLMFHWLKEQGAISSRKARLFAVACCRRVWSLMNDERSRDAILVAERLADGLLTPQEQYAAETAAKQAWIDGQLHWFAAVSAKMTLARKLPVDHILNFTPAGSPPGGENADTKKREQAELLCDIVGPIPFRPVLIDATWLAWNQRAVERLACSIYDERQLDVIGVLADALEDAGCDNEAILTHLRGPGPHVRGCWVIDLLLDKK